MKIKSYIISIIISCSSLMTALILYLIDSVPLLYPISLTLFGIALLFYATLYSQIFEKGFTLCSHHVESIMTDLGYHEEEIQILIDRLKEKYNNEIQN